MHIERDGAYANLALPAALSRGDLSDRDRAFATELVYGTLRMRRACDWLVDRFVAKPPDLPVRMALRLGAYQLAYLGTAPHAAVDATVSTAPPYSRAFVNAVLRKVAAAPTDIPDDASRLSYPDWIVDRLVADLGRDDAYAALEHMNRAPRVRMRDDGYIQDVASEWVADLVEAQPGMRVADVCAAPGGKATRLAATGALVVASDVRASRVRTMVANVEALESHLLLVVADARAPAASRRRLRPGARRCSVLRPRRAAPSSRRPMARAARGRRSPRHTPDRAGRRGGAARRARGSARVRRVHGGCRRDARRRRAPAIRASPSFAPLDPPGPPWRDHGRGGLLLPQDADTDGMFVLRLAPWLTHSRRERIGRRSRSEGADGVGRRGRGHQGGPLGPCPRRALTAEGYAVVEHRVSEDGRAAVGGALEAMTFRFAGLVVTTGGTGFRPATRRPRAPRTSSTARRRDWPRRCGS